MSTNDGVSGARMAGEERRLQILAVAVSLFSNRGFRGTTTKEIAQAAGVSEAMVFRHFATKEELYAAILDHKACRGGESFEPEKMAAEGIHRKDDRAVFAEMFFDQFVRRVYEFLGGYIRERQREGAFIDIDPAIVVGCFIGMVMLHSLNNNIWDRCRRLLNISNEEAARHFTNILLNGITAPSSNSTNR